MVGTVLALSLLTVAQMPEEAENPLDDSLRMQAVLEWGMFETPLIDAEEIERLCTKALDKKQLLPGRTWAEYYQKRGTARMDLKKYAKAIEDFEHVLREQPKNVEARYAFGYCHLMLIAGNATRDDPQPLPKAQETIALLLEEEPDSALGYHLAGCLLLTAGRHDEAREYFTRAIQLNPLYRASYWNRSLSYTGDDKYRHAIEDIERAMLLPAIREPETPLRAFRGRALTELGRDREAYGDLVAAYRQKPDSLGVLLHLWRSSAQLGRFGSCALVAREMVRSHPEVSDSYNYLALSLAQLRRFDEALPLSDKATKLEPDHKFTWGGRATVLASAGKPREAAKHFEQALRRNEKSAGWQLRYAFLLASSPVNEIRDGARAKELARAAVEQFRRGRLRGLALMVLAVAHAECGETEQALKATDEAMSMMEFADEWTDSFQQLRKFLETGKPYRLRQEEGAEPVFSIPLVLMIRDSDLVKTEASGEDVSLHSGRWAGTSEWEFCGLLMMPRLLPFERARPVKPSLRTARLGSGR